MISRSLARTIRLSITEMGGKPYWMGPLSSMCIDGNELQESALINRNGNKYSFIKVQNNQFSMGAIGFSGGLPRLISSTDNNEENILSSLGLINNGDGAIPVFCAQKLGRQAKTAWELSDFRPMMPFDGMKMENKIIKLPYYEANILSALIKNKAADYSFNFFNDEGIVEFFYEEVYAYLNESANEETVNDENTIIDDEPILKIEHEHEHEEDSEVVKSTVKNKTSISSYAIAVLVIVSCFIGFNYLKLQDQINNPFFGFDKDFIIERSGIDDPKILIDKNNPPLDLIKESRAISSSILKLLTQTDLNRYNGLTITKSFLSLEYMSGVNPNIENILGLDPTSFTVEAIGKDSTIFLWYYSFELPLEEEYTPKGDLNKIDLMVQLDTTLTDYNLKYFEQVYTRNQIYGPLLVWVKGKADILQASAIIAKLNDDILLRKFVLFNKADRPNPKAGFYISVLED